MINMDNLQIDDIPAPTRSRKNHVPMHDVGDLAFTNRHDPAFIAEITNIMQVPSTITVSNGHGDNQNSLHGFQRHGGALPMEIPDTLTAENILQDRGLNAYVNSINEKEESLNDSENLNSFASTGSQTPLIANKTVVSRSIFDDGHLPKTPQISEELFNKMRPRRSSIEVDLNSEIRQLRDKINRLEHECQINTQTNRVFYVILCGYVLVKTFSWLLKR